MNEKRHFLSYRKRHHNAQITWPHAYYATGESLQNGQLELQRRIWYFAREIHKDTAVSVWGASGRILKEYRNIVSALKQTPCGIPWGLWNHTHWSARYTNGRDVAQQESQLNLYKLNPLLPHCRSIVWELMHCYTWGRLRLLQFAATQ